MYPGIDSAIMGKMMKGGSGMRKFNAGNNFPTRVLKIFAKVMLLQLIVYAARGNAQKTRSERLVAVCAIQSVSKEHFFAMV